MTVWQYWIAQYQALALRERLLLVGATLALSFLFWDWVWVQPTEASRLDLLSRLEIADNSIKTLTVRKSVLDRLANSGPNAVLKDKLEHAQRKISILDQEIEDASLSLIGSNKVTGLLQEILEDTDSVSFISLKTLPIDTISYGHESVFDEIFRHGFEIVFEATFEETMQFLASLEGSEKQFYLDQLHYRLKNQKLKQNMMASVNITIMVLSTGVKK